MANVDFLPDAEISIPDAAFAYAKKLQDAEDEGRLKLKLKQRLKQKQRTKKKLKQMKTSLFVFNAVCNG